MARKKSGRDACAAAVTAAATVAFVPSANGTRCQSSLSRAPRRWPQFTKRRPRDSRRASPVLELVMRLSRGLFEAPSRRNRRSRVDLCANLVRHSYQTDYTGSLIVQGPRLLILGIDRKQCSIFVWRETIWINRQKRVCIDVSSAFRFLFTFTIKYFNTYNCSFA